MSNCLLAFSPQIIKQEARLSGTIFLKPQGRGGGSVIRSVLFQKIWQNMIFFYKGAGLRDVILRLGGGGAGLPGHCLAGEHAKVTSRVYVPAIGIMDARLDAKLLAY